MKKGKEQAGKHQSVKIPARAKRNIEKPKRRSPRKKTEPIPDPTQNKPEVFEAKDAEALIPIVRRALELQGMRFHLWEIAEALQREFTLNKAPSEATVWRWCEEAREAYMHDIKALTAREIASQLQTLDTMLRTWLPRAMNDLAIVRIRMRDGERIEEIDEKAFMEKAKAAAVVTKCLEMRGNILGIDRGGGLPSDNGDRTPNQLQDFLLRLATQAVSQIPAVAGKTLDKPTLTLESGVEDLEHKQ
jgi:hypothetical protein